MPNVTRPNPAPPYTDELLYNRYIMPAGNGLSRQELELTPGGYLTALMATKIKGNAESLSFILVSKGDPLTIYAQFTVKPLFTCGGKWFDPIPNLNAAYPYVLVIPPNAPELEIISVDRRQAF
jgi:hypothetical protein